MDKYEHESVVGEGSYGVVLKCRQKETGRTVAIKKFLETDEDPTVKKIAMREIRMLKRLRHENLINLIEVFRRRRKLFLVFEYVDHTVLEELEEHPKGLSVDKARSHVFQILRGIEFCHMNNIIHRDVKPENVLVSQLGVVKLCDFGFARLMAAPGEAYTDYVATRWYRAPELLVGDSQYGREVDIWAIGCLYAEMRTGDPLFPGESDIDQLFLITQCLGLLSLRHRQLIAKNPMFNGLNIQSNNQQQQRQHKAGLEGALPDWTTESMHFVKRCLDLEQTRRPPATELINSSFFTHDNFHITFPIQIKAKIQREFNHSGTAEISAAKANNNRQATNKSYAGPTATEEARAAAKKDLILRRRSDTFDSLLGFPQPLGVIGGNGGGGGVFNDNDNKLTGGPFNNSSPLQSLHHGASAGRSNKAPLYLSTTSSKNILPERRPSAISEANSSLTPPTPITPGSSASSTSQQMEKYKNARNKNPGPVAAADSSGKLRRYEGFEKDLHKILNKTSAKSTTPAAARGGGISSDVMAPLQPVRTNSRAPSTSPAPLTADGKGKRRIAGDDSSPDLRKSSNESTNNNSARKHSDQGSVENLELLSPRPPPPVPSQYKDRFNFESAFDRSFHLDDPSQINSARLAANNNPAAAGGLGLKKKKPLYAHLHHPAVYQEHKSTVLLKKRRQTEPLSLPSVSGASKLHVEGTRTLPRQRKTVGAIGLSHIDSSVAAAEDGNNENNDFLSTSSNSHNLPYV